MSSFYSFFKSVLGISVGNVDITHDHSLAGRFVITSLPTVFHCLEGSCTLYEGGKSGMFNSLALYYRTNFRRSSRVRQ